MQVAGPYDYISAVRRALPKTLQILNGETLPIEWYLADEPPTTAPNAKGKPLTYPNGAFRILAVRMNDAVASQPNDGHALKPTAQSDVIPFATGTLNYPLTQQDVSSVQSVTGTVGGTPGHVFTPGVDYTFDRLSITWTGTGTLPDNGTNVTYAYSHRLYAQRYLMASKITVRAMVRAKQFTSNAGKDYPMSILAAVLGNSLEMVLRAASGSRLTRPDAAGDQPYTETVTFGRVLAAGPLPPDLSGSMMSWFVDVVLNVGGIYETTPVPAILDIPFTETLTP